MDIQQAAVNKAIAEATINKILGDYAESTGLIVEEVKVNRIDTTTPRDRERVFIYSIVIKAVLPQPCHFEL